MILSNQIIKISHMHLSSSLLKKILNSQKEIEIFIKKSAEIKEDVILG